MTNHRTAFYTIVLGTVVAVGSVSWAQNTDLPALPPGSEASIALPPPPTVTVETPQQPSVLEVMSPPEQTQTTTNTSETTANTQAANAQTLVEPANIQPLVSPSPTSDAPVLPTSPSQTSDAPSPEMKENFTPSYGTFEQSLLFDAQSIDRMKKVLFAYESVKRPEAPVGQVKDEFTDLLNTPVATIQEPANYPTYYLSSIVYRSPKDWLFWMNGAKYTPKRMPGALRVLSMSPRGALFEWKPDFISQAKTRFEENLIDTSIPKHIKAARSYVKYDEKHEHFTVMIAPNQSFVSAAFAVYEGKHADKPVPEMKQEIKVDAVINNAPPAPIQPFRDPDAALKATMGDLQQFGGNVSQFAPRSNPNASAGAPAANQNPANAVETPAQSVSDLPVLQRAQ